MTRLSLFNRFAIAADGWIQLVPLGEHPNVSKTGEVILQIVDADALAAMQNNFRGELLLDFEHESHDLHKRTTAAGWITNVEIREDGLYAQVRWSTAGRAAVEGGEYRFISPVFNRRDCEDLGEGRVRPLRLADAGLTNRPCMPVKPISNREREKPDLEKPQPGSPHSGAATTQKDPKAMSLKLINRALDLSPDASEEATTGAVEKLKKEHAEALQTLANRDTALKDAADKLKNAEEKVAALEEDIATRDEEAITALLDAAGITDEAARTRWTSLIKADPENGKAALEELIAAKQPAKEAPAALTNRHTAKTPDTVKNRQEKKQDEPELTGRDRVIAAMKNRAQKGDE